MSLINQEPILSVSQLTRSIKNILESEYRFIRIQGEISNFKMPYSGHCYFTLKDSSAQIRAVLFKQQKRFVNLALQDGQEVVCFGRITIYEPRGEYQVVVDSVELYGTGLLQKEFENLKTRLSDKGYFLSETKKPLPSYPTKIVVISSPTGAAIQDFLKIVRIRKSPVYIQIFPVRVQGKDAAREIAEAIKLANELNNTDIIVLCRGGGSLEDLWSFNEEIVAEAIHASALPIVTGIGHESDFTIADLCADFRCPTPTAAAEKLVPDAESLRSYVAHIESGLVEKLLQKIVNFEQRLRYAIKILGNMKNVIKDSEMRLQLGKLYLVQAAVNNLHEKESLLSTGIRRLQRQEPSSRIELQQNHLRFLKIQLKAHIQRIVERKKMALGRQATLLNGVSPLATLGRGYSIVRKYNKETDTYQVITSSTQTISGDELNILLSKGQLDCIVRATREEKKSTSSGNQIQSI